MQKLDFIHMATRRSKNNYEDNIIFIIIILGQDSRIMKKLKDLKRKKTKEEDEETLKPIPYYYITYNPPLLSTHTHAAFSLHLHLHAQPSTTLLLHQPSLPTTRIAASSIFFIPTQPSHPLINNPRFSFTQQNHASSSAILPIITFCPASSSNHHHQHPLLGSSRTQTYSPPSPPRYKLQPHPFPSRTIIIIPS